MEQVSKISKIKSWSKCTNIEDIIQCNILSLDGKTIKGACCDNHNKPILAEDTMPFIQTIKNINENGFITFDSQPSSYDECLSPTIYHREYGHRQILNEPLFDKLGGLFMTKIVQKAYCDGFIKYNILPKFVNNIIKLGYEAYYYSKHHGLYCDTNNRINLTYASTGAIKYEMTNLHSVESSEEYYFQSFSRLFSPVLLNKLKEECVCIFIIDKEHNMEKNIYNDILQCLI